MPHFGEVYSGLKVEIGPVRLSSYDKEEKVQYRLYKWKTKKKGTNKYNGPTLQRTNKGGLEYNDFNWGSNQLKFTFFDITVDCGIKEIQTLLNAIKILLSVILMSFKSF